MESDYSGLGFQLEADLAADVETMRANATAGPIELARRGAGVILRLTDKSYYERPLHIVLELQGLARALLEARPDSMPLANLACEAVRPLPELYGRGKSEGARMRGDLRARIAAWLLALDERAARIEAARAKYAHVVTVQAISLDGVFVRHDEGVPSRPRYALAGPEKFVPRNYEFGLAGLQRVSLVDWDGVLTGDGPGPASVESVQNSIASLRFESILL